MTRRGCGCCGCRQFDRQWCGIADSAAATAAGVTLTGSEYSINFDLPDYDWVVVATFPWIRERANYYYGGYCGEGVDWGSGTLRHTIRVKNQLNVVLLRVQLTISKAVTGVDDHVLIEVLDTTSNFDAVLLRDYTPISSETDRNGDRYLPTMTITRREGVSSIALQDNLFLVDATPDGESFTSLTESRALYAKTEGSALDTMRISFETTWLTGDFAEPIGDWIVTGFEVANVSKSEGLTCPDPRICTVNDSSYSTPQWEILNANIGLNGLAIQSIPWKESYANCQAILWQPGAKDIHAPAITGFPSFAPDWFGRFYAVGDAVAASVEPNARWTYHPFGISNPSDKAPNTDAWTAFDATQQSFSEGVSPYITVDLLSSPTPGKRLVRARATFRAWWEPNQGVTLQNGANKICYINPVDLSVPQDWPNPANKGFDPPLASQITFDEFWLISGNTMVPHGYFDDGTSAAFRQYNRLTRTFGASIRSPTGLTTVTSVPVFPAEPSPVYALQLLYNFRGNTYTITWEKEVDEWDGAAPTVSFSAANIVSSQSLFSGEAPIDAAPVVTGSTITFDTIATVTVRYIGNPASLGQLTYTMPAYLFDMNYTIQTVDFTASTLTLTPSTGPMPQPVTPA